jgi:membrane-associated HD superfamily phosphohydrolase
MGTPYDLVARMPVILIILLIDIIFNSVYTEFRKKGKILRLIIILSIVNLIGDMVFRVIIYPFVYSSNFVTFFYGISLYLLPVVIVEAIIGGYVGYKIFQRIKNLSFLDIR